MKLNLMVYVAFALLALTACQQQSQNNGTTVPSNLSGDCVNNPSLCQNGVYQQNPGFSQYGYNNGYGYGASSYYNNSSYYASANPFYYANNSAYLCSCPIGSIPTYNTYAGLGCVQRTSFTVGFSAYAYFGWNGGYVNNGNLGTANQWSTIPQISAYNGAQNSSCYNGVVQSCLVDQPNTCAGGYVCSASQVGSRLGLCVSNGSNGLYTGQPGAR